ncbi:hypothetical protein PC9H_011761 [Pleurotus ostreatus]|uniref:Uncharacterized protein n=1 Tax=Pleurotus ostreatus TaxID=5322 RepID=A0A8H7DLS5_PLEOS|nr:uncharacterized protein PC9H_011761 [Pleurotus ostreatus]KAF7421240.1 hypothetical protein PC9H_011761 [Pleurotus ostreatus]
MAQPAQPAQPAPQPDFVRMHHGLAQFCQEIQFLPNWNAGAGGIPAMQVVFQQIMDTQAAMQANITAMQADLQLHPVRMFNATASVTADLIYPPHVPEGARPFLPRTKEQAIRLSGEDAARCSALIGLPALASEATALQHRCQFLNYLGVQIDTN